MEPELSVRGLVLGLQKGPMASWHLHCFSIEMMETLLIIEDEGLLANELARYFARQGWDVQTAPSLAEARSILRQSAEDPTVVLADMNLPDGSSLDLLEELRQQKAPVEWVLMSGYGTVPDTVRALRLGALDFIEKPCDAERLSLVLNGARRGASAQGRLNRQYVERSKKYSPEAFIGSSRPAAEVRNLIHRLSSVPISTLIISGETGTGKGLTARILHHSGPRAEGPLVEINCAALPRDLLESELFGHEAGAFTGAKGRHRGYLEQANGGTLFLDEIGEMELDLQAKLLTAIEDRQVRRLGGEKTFDVDVSIIAASNRQLERQVRERRFRSDLYHRLSVFQVSLPPLRDRLEDLRQLVPVFMNEFNARANTRLRRCSEQVYRLLAGYRWPGNIRELRNVIERAVLLSEGEELEERWLQLDQSSLGIGGAEVDGDRVIIPLDGSMDLESMDRYIIQTALARSRFNVMATARALGTTRETLRYRIKKYGLSTQPEASQSV